jgi:hypothetical protein
MKILAFAFFMSALVVSTQPHAAECMTFKQGVDALSNVIKDSGESAAVMYLDDAETDAFYKAGAELGKIPLVAADAQYDNIAFFFFKGGDGLFSIAMYDENGCVSKQRMVMSAGDFVAIMDLAFQTGVTPMFHPVRLEMSA